MNRNMQPVFLNGQYYVEHNSAPLSCGPFLPADYNSIDKYLRLPADRNLGVREHNGVPGSRSYANGLACATARGNSMDGVVRDGNVVIFQRVNSGLLDSGRVVVIEKIGDEEGQGALALKKMVIEPGSSRNEDEVERDWDDPKVRLYSRNKRFPCTALDPEGRYRVHGFFRLCVVVNDDDFMDAEIIRLAALRKAAAGVARRTPKKRRA